MSDLSVFITFLVFEIGLFMLTNWILKDSYSIGYMQISIFVKSETAPAFNFLFRVLSPVVYIIIVSTILYKVGLDQLVRNIYLVPVYYILLRIGFNIITNRTRLLNCRRQFIHASWIVIISWLTYDSLIKSKRNILPDFSTISNELWVIILLFLFQTLNNLQFSSDDTEKRKETYLKLRYYKFRSELDEIIRGVTANKKLQALAYAILTYEDFNRPKAARLIENLKFRLTKKPMTLGVMQIRSSELISDEQSVKRGVERILKDLKEIQDKREIEEVGDYRDWRLLPKLVEKFNGGQSYNQEVTELFGIIWRKYYDGDNVKYSFEDPQ